MKPQRFETGQAVTPKDPGQWTNITKWRPSGDESPAFGKVYHVHSYECFVNGKWFLCLEELSPQTECYAEPCFDPVITTSELTEALEEIETVNV